MSLSYLFLTIILTSLVTSANAEPQIILPKHRLEARELAVIVNDADPLSREIAQYYQQRRNIPTENLIHISFKPNRSVLKAEEFVRLKNQVDAAVSPDIQAYVITWAAPYRVDCMSITSAFALGFDQRWCSAKTCATTQPSAYYNSTSTAPFRDFAMRPTMALAATDFAQAKALIDRGIASDGSRPSGTAYLVSTSDKPRNVRATMFPQIEQILSSLLKIRIVQNDQIIGRKDVLFYFTGLKAVKGLSTLEFLPGAVADHLTSMGGKLTENHHMSAMRWLEAGATGSYGTVVEPCAHPTKFPNPGILMRHYVQGETLIEAYWKSVRMPGEGIFIGEPLAAPFDFKEIEVQPQQVVLKTWSLKPGLYQLQTAPALVGPYTPQPTGFNIGFPLDELRIPNTGAAVYRLQPLQPPEPAL